MTDEQVLRGLLATAAGEPVEVEVEQINPGGQDPLTAVYRVRKAFAADYQLPGEGSLSDEFGRPILLTEGFVVRAPAGTLRGRDVLTALDRAHHLVTPAYQAFWRENDEFSRRAEGAFHLLPNYAGREPDKWTDKLAAAASSLEPTGGAGSNEPGVGAETATPEKSLGRRQRLWVVIALGLFVCALVVILLLLFWKSSLGLG